MQAIKIDKLIRSKRKTIALVVAADATLIIRAPLKTSLEYITNLVTKKWDWVTAKKAQAKKYSGIIPIKPNKEQVKNYKALALQKITERVNFYSAKTGWQYKSIKITNAKKRWGSCSRNGSINFTWRLILAPLDVIDYVIVHELAHINQKNHSVKFWESVKTVLPDYLERRKWLKDNWMILKT